MTSDHGSPDPEAEERERDIQRDTHIAARTTNPGAIDLEHPGGEASEADPDCERCDGSGLDPDAYFREGGVWTHAPCSECLPEGEESETDAEADRCSATFREEPMPDTVYCQERSYHVRHTSGGGSDYYTWLDGDEGAGSDPLQ